MISNITPGQYLTRDNGRPMHHEHVYEALGIKGGRLPDEGMHSRMIGNVRVRVLSKERAAERARKEQRRFVHRVEATCPHCCRMMGVGRLHQHLGLASVGRARVSTCTYTGV